MMLSIVVVPVYNYTGRALMLHGRWFFCILCAFVCESVVAVERELSKVKQYPVSMGLWSYLSSHGPCLVRYLAVRRLAKIHEKVYEDKFNALMSRVSSIIDSIQGAGYAEALLHELHDRIVQEARIIRVGESTALPESTYRLRHFALVEAETIAAAVLRKFGDSVSSFVLFRFGMLDSVGERTGQQHERYLPGSPGHGGRRIWETHEILLVDWSFIDVRNIAQSHLRKRADNDPASRAMWEKTFHHLNEFPRQA